MASKPINSDSNTNPSTSISSMLRTLYFNRQLVFQMTQREIISRYKGSLLGLGWSFFNPVFMLLIYTIIFTEIFETRWGDISGPPTTKAEFAVILYVGIIILNFFTEILNRSPNLIISNVSFVKKVVFPLETLPVVLLVATICQTFINVIVLLGVFLIFNNYLNWTVIFFPIVLAPLVILCLGLSWLISSIGVYIRDLGQMTTMVTAALMFISPVFYPISAVPESLRKVIVMNPLTFIIEQARNVLIWGGVPDFFGLFVHLGIFSLFAWFCFIFFQKTRQGFSDVL